MKSIILGMLNTTVQPTLNLKELKSLPIPIPCDLDIVVAIGKFADIIVLDPCATPIMAARHGLSNSIEDVLFALALLGDDRAVKATYVAGQKLHGA